MDCQRIFSSFCSTHSPHTASLLPQVASAFSFLASPTHAPHSPPAYTHLVPLVLVLIDAHRPGPAPQHTAEGPALQSFTLPLSSLFLSPKFFIPLPRPRNTQPPCFRTYTFVSRASYLPPQTDPPHDHPIDLLFLTVLPTYRTYPYSTPNPLRPPSCVPCKAPARTPLPAAPRPSVRVRCIKSLCQQSRLCVCECVSVSWCG